MITTIWYTPETPSMILRHLGLTASTDTTFDMDDNDDDQQLRARRASMWAVTMQLMSNVI